MSVSQHFLASWHESLAVAVSRTLLAEARKAQVPGLPLDLGSHRVIIPSQFAARLIREQLALQTQADDGGVLLPTFQTPTEFLNWGDDDAQAASSTDALLAWITVLEATDRAELPTLLPGAEPGYFTFKEAKRLAQTLYALRDELGGSATGHDFTTVATLPDNPEPQRWQDLAKLEVGYRSALQSRGRKDHNDLRTALAKGTGKPEGVTHLWLACLPEPQPLFITALARMREDFSIHSIIGAAENEASHFDEWGRPLASGWNDRRSDWRDFNDSVHVVGDPNEGLRRLYQLLGSGQPADGVHAVCACDREVDAPKIAALIHSMGAEAVNPLGAAHGSHFLHHALRTWSRFLGAAEPDFAQAKEALLIPALVRALTGSSSAKTFTLCNEQMDAADRALLRGPLSDVCHQIAQMPAVDATDFRKKAESDLILAVPAILASLLEQRAKHLQLPWQAALTETILMLIGPKKLRADDIKDGFTMEVADRLIEEAGKVAEATEGSSLDLTHEELLGVTLDAAATQRFRRNDAEEAINLPGWVEAPWEPVAHLILYGLNDHLIPRVSHAHPFLPAAMRKLVGLPSNEAGFAAAAFALEQFWRQREGTGYLDIIVPQQDADGNPLRPSRLLFLGPDETLTARVEKLFTDTPNTEAQPYWEIPAGHKLSPLAEQKGADKAAKTISATAFKTYLADPSEYWMKRALGLNETEHGRVELDSAGFGTLVHGTLERFGREYVGRSTQSLEEIKESFLKHLDDQILDSLGGRPAVALQMQARAARARLLAFAPIQAKLFADGWLIDTIEGTLPLVEIEKVTIKGKFDRLDRHIDGQKWRVYDYKTFAKAATPLKKHVRPAQVGDAFTAEVNKRDRKQAVTGTKTVTFIDLQLPVYHLALLPELMKKNPQATLEIGYICLPADTKGTVVYPWPFFDTDHSAATKATITEICQRLHKGGNAAYLPGNKASKYPLLGSLACRPAEGYLNLNELGEVRV